MAQGERDRTVAENGSTASTPGAAFKQGYVEADGFRIRYMESGQGPALVHLHGGGGLQLTPAHDLLSRSYRVVAFEMPGFGQSPENTRTQTMAELAGTMLQAVTSLGVDRFNLWGTSFGGKTALWLAVQAPQRVQALVLESPAAIRGEGPQLQSASPDDLARRLYAHPERIGPLPAPDPAVRAKTWPMVGRLMGPSRDAELEARMRELPTPTLVLFGTVDTITPPELGRFYKELLPNCSLVFVYDAAHAISTDRPEAFAEVVADFLERHEAFIISRRETVINP
jgi:pimeloyl-ACP methyl ester carboxylesterase